MTAVQFSSPAAFLVHQCQGRLRMKIPDKRGDEHYFRRLEQHLTAMEGVLNVKSSTLTGSVILRTSTTFNITLLEKVGIDKNQFQFYRYGHRPLAKKLAEDFSQLDSSLQSLSQGRIDLKSIYFGAFITMAIIQISKGKTLGPASGYIWDAIQLLQEQSS